MHAHRRGDGRAPARGAGGILIGHQERPDPGTERRMRRMRRGTRYGALLGPLLAGDAAPDLVARAARGLGLPERGRYAVVVLGAPVPPAAVVQGPDTDGTRWWWGAAASFPGTEAGREGWEVQRAQEGWEDRRAHGPREGRGAREAQAGREAQEAQAGREAREVAVVLLGPAGPARAVVRLRELGAGPGGVSPVVGSPAELGAARRLAGTALLTCEPGSREIVRLDERLPAALLVSRPELSTRLLAEVFGPLLTLVPAERSLLVGTLEAWMECGGSVGRAAARLGCHRNTVFNRLRRLERLTARSLSRPRELVDLVLALDVLRLSSAPPRRLSSAPP
ncbi:helix-turn-helix domain-containing protein [Streptomyces sp. RHZ10]|uniref:Helix-turn-helix domain-containing protein n=2 Tax=Streptomyces durocortorensis TaxID=2811104 RepID=A0ABS2HWE8_9ACTN|nr:helix-turn-helix domain-containing protein [Streptomyces durocortorensis]